MNIADDLKKLQDLHQSGGLTDEEFAAAKARVLAGGKSESDPHLDEIKRQNEIERLDREWQMERERYMVAGRYGQRYLPSRGMSVIGGIMIVGFGIVWTGMASSMGAPFFFPMFGVIFILAGIAVSLYTFLKAGAYEEAFRRYQMRRATLLARQDNDSKN
jgi:hypothetical protein